MHITLETCQYWGLTLTACGQTKNSETIKGLIIDSNIKNKVEKHIDLNPLKFRKF